MTSQELFKIEDYVAEVRVPEGHVYVLGDNTRSSRDSRAWGYVPIEDIKGPAVAIWWPPKRVGRLK